MSIHHKICQLKKLMCHQHLQVLCE
jgi:hypothetical protein